MLQSAPAAVTLTFSEELVGLQPVLLVTGPDGQANHAAGPGSTPRRSPSTSRR